MWELVAPFPFFAAFAYPLANFPSREKIMQQNAPLEDI